MRRQQRNGARGGLSTNATVYATPLTSDTSVPATTPEPLSDGNQQQVLIQSMLARIYADAKVR
jgi:hypothetical protein